MSVDVSGRGYSAESKCLFVSPSRHIDGISKTIKKDDVHVGMQSGQVRWAFSLLYNTVSNKESCLGRK